MEHVHEEIKARSKIRGSTPRERTRKEQCCLLDMSLLQLLPKPFPLDFIAAEVAEDG
jgi:hypothetical protein